MEGIKHGSFLNEKGQEIKSIYNPVSDETRPVKVEEIKAGDLMIGSWITVDNPTCHPQLKDVPVRIIEIVKMQGLQGEWTYALGLEVISNENNPFKERYSQLIEFIRPIPLTEDILLKAGAKRIEENKVSIMLNDPSTHSVLMKVGTHWYPTIEQVDELGEIRIVFLSYIDHLHQAQNLFKSLTGNDLKIEV